MKNGIFIAISILLLTLVFVLAKTLGQRELQDSPPLDNTSIAPDAAGVLSDQEGRSGDSAVLDGEQRKVSRKAVVDQPVIESSTLGQTQPNYSPNVGPGVLVPSQPGPDPGENEPQVSGPGPGENEPQVSGPGPGENEPQVSGPAPEAGDTGALFPAPEAGAPSISYPAPEAGDPGMQYPAPEANGPNQGQPRAPESG